MPCFSNICMPLAGCRARTMVLLMHLMSDVLVCTGSCKGLRFKWCFTHFLDHDERLHFRWCSCRQFSLMLPLLLLCPYLLRQVEGGWKLSASFPVDSVGEYTLRLTRQVDVTKLKHISTRRSSEYDVVIPQMEVRRIAVINGSVRTCVLHGSR